MGNFSFSLNISLRLMQSRTFGGLRSNSKDQPKSEVIFSFGLSNQSKLQSQQLLNDYQNGAVSDR